MTVVVLVVALNIFSDIPGKPQFFDEMFPTAIRHARTIVKTQYSLSLHVK